MTELDLGGDAPVSRFGDVSVVDDDEGAREAMVGLVRAAGLSVRGFESANDFLAVRDQKPPMCLVLDIDMPGFSGLELQQKLAASNVHIPIIFVSGHADVPLSVRALKAGAREFFTKPYDPDELLEAIRACAIHRSATEGSLAAIVGQSASLLEALVEVETVAKTEATVLVYGETGTGKELVARAIHAASPRRNGPFVKLNCAAVPLGLIESELMGHERGAFTGAISKRIGRFELAQDGTIFLDEIGEIPLELQPKLLRLLQEREFERLGGTKTIHSNARLVAATNRDLESMVADRTFREDLFYRLSVFPITLPPLRERRGDVPVLVTHFVRDIAARMQKDIRRVSSESMDRLVEYDWPGNVRELQNVLERAVILAQGTTLEVKLPHRPSRPTSAAPPSSGPTSHAPESADLASISREHILRVLEQTKWVIAGPDGAAAKLGLKRSTLHFRMKKLGITRRPTD